MKLLFIVNAFFLSLQAAAAAAGAWEPGQLNQEQGKRSYFVYTPARLSASPTLVVMLHGCMQNAADFAADTGMNAVADEAGFVVVYPEQTIDDNALQCWNWFKPENQKHNSGELLSIVTIVQKVIKDKFRGRTPVVFVAGLSAGAAMAANLAACQNELVSAVALHSGLEFRAATDEATARDAMANGPSQDLLQSGIAAAKCSQSNRSAPMPLLVIHGEADSLVSPMNASRIISQFTHMNDLLDDGVQNGSQSDTAMSTWAGTRNRYSVKRKTFGDGRTSWLESIRVKELGHAWSGAAHKSAYSDSFGPNAAQEIWRFFSSRRKP